jgi:hypothetical protein
LKECLELKVISNTRNIKVSDVVEIATKIKLIELNIPS